MMTTILETNEEAKRLQAEARAIAAGIKAAGAEPGASEAAKAGAAAAQRIIQKAEDLATLTPIAEANRRKRELAQFEDDETEAIEAAGATDESVQAALARLDRHREGFELRLAQHRFDAWQAAHAALVELVRALLVEDDGAPNTPAPGRRRAGRKPRR